MIVLFYQTKRLIKTISNKDSKFIPILAILPFFSNTIFEFTGTYYIDNFSLIFIMELACMIFEFNKNFFKDKKLLYMSFLISGIATGIKVSNLLLIFPFYIYILIKNIKDIKSIKIIDVCICIIFFILPFIVYVIDNIIQTGSPLFPYYNNIFKSKYFANISWSDPRYGINNWWQAFIWPFMTIIEPMKVYDYYMPDASWAIGYLVLLLFLGYSILNNKKIENKKSIELGLLTFILTLIWAKFLMGYTRYAALIPTLYLVIFSNIVLSINKLPKIIKIVGYMLSVILIISFIWISGINYYRYVNYIKSFAKSSLETNFLVDRCNEKIQIDGAWLAIGDDCKLVTLVREKGTPIYNLETKFVLGYVSLEMQQELREAELYTLVDKDNEAKKLESLKNNNFEIIETIYEDLKFDFLSEHNTVDMYKVKYIGD